MNILVVSTEVTPFAKAGGLADVAASLPLEWQKYGQNPVIIMPKYGFIDPKRYGFVPTELVLNVPMSWWTEYATLWYGNLPGSEVPVYLIDNADYFGRYGIYGDPYEYKDNDRRFIFFSRAVFEAAKALNFQPDIIHAHDFHAAFTMAFLKSQFRYDPMFHRTAGVYTIHNLAYQGWFEAERAMGYAGFDMKEFYPGCWFEKYGKVNAMKTGIMFADKITTVSPTYANEIRMTYYSEGMQDVLNLRGADLIGVLNGVYYDDWNPETDTEIYKNFGLKTLDDKKINKYKLLSEFGITKEDNPDLPLVGMVSRLTEQKGVIILRDLLEHYLGTSQMRFVLLGSGDPGFEDYFRYLQWKYPDKALINLGYNNNIAHKIMAGSDFLFVPSRYEPCGLTQMYALKYGTIPIVRSTGGLADTVKEYIPETGIGNGFSFMHYYAEDFSYAIRRALRLYQAESHWDIIRQNAMESDFSSSKSALEYLKVFKWALEKVR